MNFTEILNHHFVEDTYVASDWPNSNMGHCPVLLLYKKRYSDTAGYVSRIFLKIKNFINSDAYKLLNDTSFEKSPNSSNKCYLRLYFHRLGNYVDYIIPDATIDVAAVSINQGYSDDLGIGVYPEMATPGFSYNYSVDACTIVQSTSSNINTKDIERGYIDIELSLSMLQYELFMIKFNDETVNNNYKNDKSYGFCFHSLESNDGYRSPKLIICTTHLYNDYFDKIYGDTTNNNIVYYPIRDVDENFCTTYLAGKNYKICLSDSAGEYFVTGSFSNVVDDFYSSRFNNVKIDINYFFQLADDEYIKKYEYKFYVENTLMYTGSCNLYKNIYAIKKYEYRYDVLYRYMLSFNDGIQLNIYKYDSDESYIKKYVHQSLVNTVDVGDGFEVLDILPEYIYFEIYDPLEKKLVEIANEPVKIYFNRDGYRNKFISFIKLKEFLPENKRFILKFYKTDLTDSKFLFEEDYIT